MKSLALALITGYQAWISPHKGYCCAYRAHTGGASCSALGYRAIRRHGLRHGLAILRERLFLCGVAPRRHGRPTIRPQRYQRGDCDPGCGDLSCDFDTGGRSRCVDALQCVDVLDCCGSEDRKRRRKGKGEAEVPLPRRQ